MAQPMEADLLRCLQEHLTMERQASAAYWALSIWFAERELRGFAQFCKAESSSEQHHAGLFADYLIARGQTVQLEPLEAPRQSWNDPEEVFSGIFQMEAEVTTSLQQLYALAERCSDLRTTVFLDPLVQGQIEADHVVINGHVIGPVHSRSLLELQPKARIEGDVHYAALEMHQGALISGQMKPSDTEKPLLTLAANNR